MRQIWQLVEYSNSMWKGSGNPFPSFPKRLQPAEIRDSTFSRKLLAVYFAIRSFRHALPKSRQFCVYTDHKPLTHTFQAKPDRYSLREVRHLDYVSQFTTDIRHVSGKEVSMGKGVLDLLLAVGLVEKSGGRGGSTGLNEMGYIKTAR